MRSVTMKEIDALRATFAAHQKRIHKCRENNGPRFICEGCQSLREEGAKLAAQIEERLVQWWAQGCKEVPYLTPVDAPVPAYGTLRHEATVAVNLLNAIAKQNGLRSGGEEYPNLLCVADTAQRLTKALERAATSSSRPALAIPWSASEMPATRADGLRCAYCDLPFLATDSMRGAGTGAKTSSDEGARFMHNECFFRDKSERLEAAEAARKHAKPDCACTVFDDGAEFGLSAFAGGAAPDGAYSYIHCIEKKPDGREVTHRYVRESQPQVALPRQARAAADALAAEVEVFGSTWPPDTHLGRLSAAVEVYRSVAESGVVPDIYDEAGFLDARKLTALLMDVLTGGGFHALIATLEDEVLPDLRSPKVQTQEHDRALAIQLAGRLTTLGVRLP